MKYGWLFSLCILFGLIAAPEAAASAASDAALLWWTRVVPALLPYLIASSLLTESGLSARFNRRAASLLLLPLGMLGGYPVGAKLAGRLYRDGTLTLSHAQTIAAFINLPNPVFLISVVSAGMFGVPRAAVPLLLGIGAAALPGLIPLLNIHPEPSTRSASAPFVSALPKAISDGVQSILNVGGCLVFASVLGALLNACGIFRLFGSAEPVARAVSLGLFEMTTGVGTAVSLPFSLSVRLAIAAFLIQFGGLSVMMQSASVLPLSLPRYCLIRLLTALAAAAAVFFLTPLFCPEETVSVMANGRQMLRNASDLAGVTISAAFGLLLIFVFTFGLSKRKRTP